MQILHHFAAISLPIRFRQVTTLLTQLFRFESQVWRVWGELARNDDLLVWANWWLEYLIRLYMVKKNKCLKILGWFFQYFLEILASLVEETFPPSVFFCCASIFVWTYLGPIWQEASCQWLCCIQLSCWPLKCHEMSIEISELAGKLISRCNGV